LNSSDKNNNSQDDISQVTILNSNDRNNNLQIDLNQVTVLNSESNIQCEVTLNHDTVMEDFSNPEAEDNGSLPEI
jgi:hypothetical protein